MIEFALIKLLIQDREVYLRYFKFVLEYVKDQVLRQVLTTIDLLREDGDEELTIDDVELRYVAVYGTASQSEQTEVKLVFDNIRSATESENVTVLLQSLRKRALLNDLALAAYNAAEGHEDDETVLTLVKDIQEAKTISDEGVDFEFVTDDLEELYQSKVSTPGLRWRLNSLNKAFGSLRRGDFIVVFKRPETGGTTFLASEVTYMAENTDRPILWINNEQEGGTVKFYLYRASLGQPLERILVDRKASQAEYLRRTGGRIKLYDDANTSRQDIEAMCVKHQPALVVVDQIAKVKGFKADRPDLEMGQVCIWARELCKKWCPVIGIHQADGTADGVKWLNMGHVANVKTALQAECDGLLGIGMTFDVDAQSIRYFNISKNKLMGDPDSNPSLRHGRWDVRIRPEIARYEDFLV